MPFVPDDQSAAPAPAPVPSPVAPAQAPAPVSAAPAKGVFVPDPPPSTWGVSNWSHGGDVTLPQWLQDAGDVAGESASAGAMLPMARAESQAKGQSLDLPTQLAQLAAAKARLGSTGAAAAETFGNLVSPTNLLNWVPGIGGAMAGASHGGLQSYFEGGDVAADTLKGAAAGALSTGASHVLANPSLLASGTDLAGTLAGMSVIHGLFKDSPVASQLGGQWASRAVQPIVKRVEESSGPLMAKLRPFLATAIQAPASTLQQTPGSPWNQWIPGQ